MSLLTGWPSREESYGLYLGVRLLIMSGLELLRTGWPEDARVVQLAAGCEEVA